MKLRKVMLKDFDFVYQLTTNPEVYPFIRNGKIWDRDKVKRFIDKSIESQKIDVQDRTHFNYIIESDDSENVGIIGFSQFKNKYSMTVSIDPKFQGQGFFSKSLKLLISRIKKYRPELKFLFAQTHLENKKMNSILSNKFKFVKKFNIGKIQINEYKIPL